MANDVVAPSPLVVAAAIILPPLGVFLAHGLRSWFWIALVLTIIGWVPGVIFALVVVLKPELLARA